MQLRIVVTRPLATTWRVRFRPDATAEFTHALTVGQAWLGDELAPALPVAGLNAADGRAIWLLLDDSGGTTLQAVLVRLIGPGEVESIQRVDVPQPVTGFAMSDDDTLVALGLGFDEPWPFVLARVSDDAPTTATSPVIEGLRIGLVPATAGEEWPGG